MLHVYAITDRAGVLPAVRGLSDTPLDEVVERELAAVYTVHGEGEVAATEDALWRHEEVVEALMAQRTVLPVRFGIAFRRPAAIAAELEKRYGALTETLRRVRGRVELGLRVVASQPEKPHDGESTPGDAPGRAYLLARVERVRRARALADEIERELAPHAAASTHRLLETPRLLVSSAYLVDRERVGAFRERVAQLGATHEELDFLCTGPWPAYSFVSADSDGR